VNLLFILVAGLGLASAAASDVKTNKTLVPELRLTEVGTFNAGSQTCQSWGMWPLSIHNEATQRAAWELCPDNCYIGLRRSTTSNGPAWYYDDGSRYDYSAWDTNEPSDHETVVTIYKPGFDWWNMEHDNPTVCWHDWNHGEDQMHMICGMGAASESPQPSNSPAASPSQTSTPSLTPSSSGSRSMSNSASSTTSPSMSASNTPGVCRSYCVGEFGLCQNPGWHDYTCYPFDDFGNCPVNTVSCPDVTEAETVVLCETCAMGTSGSCQHSVDGVCSEHLDESGVCPPGLTFCGATF